MAPPDRHTSQRGTACHQLLFDDTDRERDTQECWTEGSGNGGVRCLRLLSPKLTMPLFFYFVRCLDGLQEMLIQLYFPYVSVGSLLMLDNNV